MSFVLPLLAGCIGLDKVPSRDSADTGGAVLGGLTVDVTEIDFGDIPVGDAASQDITFGSEAPTALEALLDDAAGVYSLSATSLSVDGSGVLTVGFSPGSEGTFAGTITLTVDGGDTLVLPLTGAGTTGGGDTDTGGEDSGTQTEGGPALVVDPSRYDFGDADLDEELTASFTVRNDGDDDLLVSDVDFDTNDFTLTGGTLQTPQLISPGGSKTLEVTFAPSGEGAVSGTLTLTSDDPDGDVEVPLTGQGVDRCDICAPIIDVDTGSEPYAITDFFSLFGSEDTRTIVIQNIGDEDLTVSRVFVNNDTLASCGAFSVSGFSSARTLAPWDTTTFDLTYQADSSCLEVAQASFDANVAHIYSDDPSEPDWIIELSGAGLSP